MVIVPQLYFDFDTPAELKFCTYGSHLVDILLFRVKVKATGRLCTWCKPCEVVDRKVRYYADVEAKRKYLREKAREYRIASPDKYNEQARRWRLNNPESARAASRRNDLKRRGTLGAYLAATRDHRLKRNAEYRQCNQDRIKAYNAQYRLDNKDAQAVRVAKCYAAKSEHYREKGRLWKQANPDMVKAMQHNRRARILGNGGKYTAKQWQALKAKYDYRCLMCQRQEPHIRLTVDHVIPVSKGGSSDISNLEPLCKSCNSKKHRKLLDFR